jgi:SAM-dependent methyltransferase
MEKAPSPPPACPCCKGGAWTHRWPGFVICRDCGLMTVEQAVSVEELRQWYGPAYFQGREYIDYLADKAAHQKTLAQHLRQVRRDVPAGRRILEIGCAYGFFLELIAKDYPGSVGLDVSRAAVAHARQRDLDAREGDLLDIQWSERFDAVCMWDTIEHLTRPADVLRRACDLLNPGGHVFVTTGDFGSWLARVQGLKWRQIHPPTHLFYFTRPALRALCQRLGLEVIEFSTVRVYRRIGSALHALARFHAKSLSGRCAAVLLKWLPACLLGWCVPLNLGDTVCLVARKPALTVAA